MSAEPAGARRVTIAEPATVLTDLALSAQTARYASRMRRRASRDDWSSTLWALAFAASAVAALVGAITHAIREDTRSAWLLALRKAVWKCVGLSTAAASGFMLLGSLMAGVSPRRRAPLLAAAVLKAFAFAAAGWKSGNFLLTIVDYATSMVIVLFLQVRDFRISRAAPWLTSGIIVSFAGAAIQRSGFALHPRFNHNDLYHLVQMGAFHLLYEGARRQEDPSAVSDR